MKKENFFVRLRQPIIAWSIVSLLFVGGIALAVWDNNPYDLGETLNPECSPDDPGCTIATSTLVGPQGEQGPQGETGTSGGGGFDENGQVTSPVVKGETTIGSERLTNGDFDSWTAGSPDGWSILDQGGSTETTTEETGIINTPGGSSVKIIAGADDSKAVYQGVNGLTPGQIKQIIVNGYTVDTNSSSVASFVLMNGEYPSGATQVWIPTDLNSGSWTDMDGNPGPSVLTLDQSIGDWENVTLEVPVPTSTNIYIYLLNGNSSENDVVYFDDISLKSITYADNVELFGFYNPSDATNLTSNDNIFSFQTTGGTDKNHFEMTGAGAFNTDYPNFNFSSAPVSVGNATAPQNALNQQTGISVLGESDVIDFTQTGLTTLYTVPDGYSAYIEQFDADLTLDNYTVGFAGSIGSGPDYQNYNTWSTFSSLFSTGKVSFGAGGGANSFTGRAEYSSGSVIKLKITTGATANTLSGTLRTIGYLIAE